MYSLIPYEPPSYERMRVDPIQAEHSEAEDDLSRRRHLHEQKAFIEGLRLGRARESNSLTS